MPYPKNYQNITPGGAPYQDKSTGVPDSQGGDTATNGAKDFMKPMKSVADSTPKTPNPQSATKADPGSMKPNFYQGAAINAGGPDRNK